MLCLLIALQWFAAGQEEGLYAPAPPADAAFVRIFNATSEDVNPTLGAVTYEALPQGSASPYQVVTQGANTLTAGPVTSTLELSAGRFYTVVLTDSANLIEDPSLSNRAKTLLLLYNLSDEAVTLKTADGSTEVIPEVASGLSGSVEVNPVAVALGVFSGETAVETFDEVQLERGAVYSAFVLPQGSAVFSQNTTTAE